MFIFNMVYNFCSSILRAVGDTKSPLIYLTIAGVVNVVLNFFLIFPTRSLTLLGMHIMMPGADGFEFASSVRETNKEIPILFVTAKDDFMSKRMGYGIGIDDYMVKPIDLDELNLKIGALLRRAKIAVSKKVVIGNLVLDAEEHTAYYGDEEIALTVREFDIIFKMLSYPKKTFTRSQLMNEFWDVDTNSSTRTVDVYMTKLREKFSCCEEFEIVTVHGLGYKAVLK